MNQMVSKFEFNPIVVKELRSRMRGGRTFLTLSIILLLTGAAMIGMISLLTSTSGSGLNMLSYQVGSILFTLLVNLELVIICVVMPSVTAGAISGEAEKLTLDLLLATPLNPSRILIGKLISAMSYILILLFAAIPMASIVFVFGGVTLSSMVKAFIILLVTAIMAGCIGLFFSAWFRKTGRATIISLVTMIVLMLLPMFISVILLVTNQNEVPRWLVAMSPLSAVSSTVYSVGANQGYNPLSILFFGGLVDQTLVPVSRTSIPRPVYHYSMIIFSFLSMLFYLGAVSLMNPMKRWHLSRRQILTALSLFLILAVITVAGFFMTANRYEWYMRDASNEVEIIPTPTPDDFFPEESEKIIVPAVSTPTPTPLAAP